MPQQASPDDRRVRTEVLRRVRDGFTPAARYSGLHVHASGLFSGGRGAEEVRSAGNVENGLRSLTMCAERTLIAGAVDELGPDARLERIAVWSAGPTLSPCCACRQAIHDASCGQATVSWLRDGRWVTSSIAELLPDAPDLTPLPAGTAPPRGASPLLSAAIAEHARRGLGPTEVLAMVRTAAGGVYASGPASKGPSLNAAAVSAAVWKAVNREGTDTRLEEVACWAPVAVTAPDGYARGVIEEFGGSGVRISYAAGAEARTRTLEQMLPWRHAKRPAVRAPQRQAEVS